MGGTPAKASLIKDFHPEVTSSYYVGGYVSGHPMMLPVVDLVEVGNGGGSIAWNRSRGWPEDRSAKRRRVTRPGLLRSRRDRADGDRCKLDRRKDRSGIFPRQRHSFAAEKGRAGDHRKDR